jgi:hypothetical protein
MGCLTLKPVITQVEVDRNDFGECTGSSDLGTVWSWEDTMTDVPVDNHMPVYSKAETIDCDDDYFNCEFEDPDSPLDAVPDNFRRPVPAGMTIESLVEEMEENEDTVECKVCEELHDKTECHKDDKLGWVCEACSSKQLKESVTTTWTCFFDDREVGTVEAATEYDAKVKMMDKYPEYHYGLYDGCFWVEPADDTVLTEAIDSEQISNAIASVIDKVAGDTSDDNKLKILLALLDFTTPENLDKVFALIKQFAGTDPVLTDEDKDALAAKLKIDRKLLDTTDTLLTALLFIYKKAPIAAGLILDIFEISPVDELVLGLPTEGIGAVIAAILSFIPDKAILGALASIRGFVGEKVVKAIKDIIIHKVLPEPKKEALTEASKYKDSIELHYDSLTAEIITGGIPATWEDPAESIEGEYTDEYDFEVETSAVEEALWDHCLTEEDVASIPGGFEALEDEATWKSFMDAHFDELVEKYYDKLLELFRDEAEEAAAETFQDRYNDSWSEGPDPDRAYDEWRDRQLFGERLEESDDEFYDRLTFCPECGSERSFDRKAGCCLECKTRI